MAETIQPRWLSPEQAATYIGKNRDELPRLRKAGKIPAPSTHLGPRQPRYDRIALDALFNGGTRSPSDAQEAIDALCQALASGR